MPRKGLSKEQQAIMQRGVQRAKAKRLGIHIDDVKEAVDKIISKESTPSVGEHDKVIRFKAPAKGEEGDIDDIIA